MRTRRYRATPPHAPEGSDCGAGCASEADKSYSASLSQLGLFSIYHKVLIRFFEADGQFFRERKSPLLLRNCGSDAAPITMPKEPHAALADSAGVGKRQGDGFGHVSAKSGHSGSDPEADLTIGSVLPGHSLVK